MIHYTNIPDYLTRDDIDYNISWRGSIAGTHLASARFTRGWSIKDSATTPPKQHGGSRYRKVEYKPEDLHPSMSHNLLIQRLRRGRPPEEAMKLPRNTRRILEEA